MNYVGTANEGKTICAVDEISFAKYADMTSANLKEAELVFNEICNNMFGLSDEPRVEAPSVNCLRDVMARNVEDSRSLLTRLIELKGRMFG